MPDVVEVHYLYALKGGSLYQPVYLGPCDDIESWECVVGQLKYKAGWAAPPRATSRGSGSSRWSEAY